MNKVVGETQTTSGEKFGAVITELVKGATELDKLEKKAIEKESSWQTRKDHTIHFLEYEATVDQLLVSGADKLDNLRSIVYDHERIGEAIWQRFNASKQQQEWYYTSIAGILKTKGVENKILEDFGNEMEVLCKKAF
ncbi:MAG: HD domain-containing protein [Ferruginibacter sp.]